MSLFVIDISIDLKAHLYLIVKMGNCPCPCFKQIFHKNALQATDNERQGQHFYQYRESMISQDENLIQNNTTTQQDQLEQKLIFVRTVATQKKTKQYNTVIVQSLSSDPPKMAKQSSQQLYTVNIKQKKLRKAQSQKLIQEDKDLQVYLNENIVHTIKSQKNQDSEDQFDTRIKNEQHQQYPYNCIGLIVAKRLNKKNKYEQFIGTGFLISSNLVLTAAHNIFFKQTNSQTINIKFYPKLHGQIKDQSQKRVGIDKRINEKYLQQKGSRLDYALIKIDKQVIRDRYIMIGQDYPKLTKAFIYGYPSDLNQDQLYKYYQFGANGDIVSNQEQILLYKIDTTGGQSGSPIVVQFVQGLYFVVGIHASYSSLRKLNCGTLLDNEKVKMIKEWIEELSPESKYIVINFKEIKELPQYNGVTYEGTERLKQIELYLKQIEAEQAKEMKGDKLRWLLVETAKKYRTNGQYQQCLSHLQRAEAVCKIVYVEAGLQQASVKNEQGMTYYAMKQYEPSIQAYKAALAIYTSLQKDKNRATIYSNIGNCYNGLKNLKEAEKYYKQSLQINEKYFSEESDKFSIYYTNFGNFLMNAGKYKQAEQLLLKALKIKQQSKQKKDKQSLPKYYFNLATCHFMLEKFQESLNGFFKTIQIMERLNFTKHQKFNKYLKGFKKAICQCLKQEVKKQLLLLASTMVQNLIKYDEQQLKKLLQQLKKKIQKL